MQRKTKGWLRHWRFHDTTGLPQANVRFCRKRPDKAPICKQLKITHFVDDRLDVLAPMVGIVPKLYLFGEQKKGLVVPNWATPVANWQQTLDAILGPDAN